MSYRIEEAEYEEIGTVYSVVDTDGAPISQGHFTDKNDAEYVLKCMNEQESRGLYGDWVSNLTLGQPSNVYV